MAKTFRVRRGNRRNLSGDKISFWGDNNFLLLVDLTGMLLCKLKFDKKSDSRL